MLFGKHLHLYFLQSSLILPTKYTLLSHRLAGFIQKTDFFFFIFLGSNSLCFKLLCKCYLLQQVLFYQNPLIIPAQIIISLEEWTHSFLLYIIIFITHEILCVHLTGLRHTQLAGRMLFLSAFLMFFLKKICIWISRSSKEINLTEMSGHHPIHWWSEENKKKKDEFTPTPELSICLLLLDISI